MTCYVIGASGLIGGELVKKLRSIGKQTVGTRNSFSGDPQLSQLDLRRDDVSSFVSVIRASDTVFLLAAYSNPSWIYENQEEATVLNRDGTMRLIDALRSVQPHLVFMSSVEVFDGAKGMYTETDIPRPLNFYGELKYEVSYCQI